jgi:hypothetical protein
MPKLLYLCIRFSKELHVNIMSKTTKIQIEMSRNLFEGLRRHVREMGERGVSNNETKTK